MSQPTDDVVNLISAIDAKVSKVHTQSLDLSFNELLDMHQNGELNISPEYQRLFQWSEGARSRFIESLLLEMPVPPIYVLEEEDGRYLLIDGLQRISSYLHLRGELDAPHVDPPVAKGDKLRLEDCDIVEALNGKTYDDLGTALQIRLKRAFIRVEVVRKGSDSKFRYYMFKRLNTGGQKLTEQQIRNCTIRLLDPTFNDFIIELSNNEDFKLCIETLSYQQKITAYDQELVLRFFALRNWKSKFKHDVADFLTEYMEAISDPSNGELFDYEEQRAAFLKTFAILAKTLGYLAFSFYNPRRTATKTGTLDDLMKGFGIYQYESFVLGLQPHLASIDPMNDDQMSTLKQLFLDIKVDAAFVALTTGGGKNSPGPLNQRIQFVADRVGAAV